MLKILYKFDTYSTYDTHSYISHVSNFQNVKPNAGYDETDGIASRRGILRSITGRHAPGGSQAVVTARNEWTSLLSKDSLRPQRTFFKKKYFCSKK